MTLLDSTLYEIFNGAPRLGLHFRSVASSHLCPPCLIGHHDYFRLLNSHTAHSGLFAALGNVVPRWLLHGRFRLS